MGLWTGPLRVSAIKVEFPPVLADSESAVYEKLQDLRGQCEMLAKKAVIARLRGDTKLSEDWATKYMTLYERQFERRGASGSGEIF